MKTPIMFVLVLLLSYGENSAQDKADTMSDPFPYEASTDQPFGLPNPEAPAEIQDFAPLIGACDCLSVKRIDKDNWSDTTSMYWRWKYIMNGMAVQDESLHEDGSHAGSIRQFIPDSARWFVHYYSQSGATPRLPTWEGVKKGDGTIILYNDQKAPNGMDGKYKITFYDITEEGFKWHGEWVDVTESFSYSTWRLICTKRK